MARRRILIGVTRKRDRAVGIDDGRYLGGAIRGAGAGLGEAELVQIALQERQAKAQRGAQHVVEIMALIIERRLIEVAISGD